VTFELRVIRSYDCGIEHGKTWILHSTLKAYHAENSVTSSVTPPRKVHQGEAAVTEATEAAAQQVQQQKKHSCR
jgi:hypothetical protein